MSEERKCTNCAFCDEFKYNPKDPDAEQMFRCWRRSEECDYIYVRKISEAEQEKDVCAEHRFKEERDAELFEKAKHDYVTYKRLINELEEKYPSLKDLNCSKYLD